MAEATRGMRLNNPCNIRLSKATWLGEIAPSSDTEFEQFSEVVYGLRAGCKILRNYHRLYGLSTVVQIISRWAPPTENETASYIDSVANACGIDRDAQIDLSDNTIMA